MISASGAAAPYQVPCERCPMRSLDGFRAFTAEELAFVSRFKRGELRVSAGTTILSEGNHSEHLYTVLSGWGFRYKMLENGERQILNFVMPGDLIGLQASLDDKMGHSVEALSDALLCVFERGQLFELYRNYPGLAFDVTWLAAREERMLDEHLLSIGRRTARQRAAYLIYFVFSRAAVRGMTSGRTFRFPLTQRHIADALGLSLVHTNRVLNQLVRRQALSLTNHVLRVNPKVLAEEADWEPDSDRLRPYI